VLVVHTEPTDSDEARMESEGEGESGTQAGTKTTLMEAPAPARNGTKTTLRHRPVALIVVATIVIIIIMMVVIVRVDDPMNSEKKMGPSTAARKEITETTATQTMRAIRRGS